MLMSAFSKWLESVHTANDVIHWIIQRLTEWRSSELFSRAQSDMRGLLQAINAQDQIGWLAFLEGCIAVKWAGVQDAHFLWLGGRNTGKRWATSLLVKLWESHGICGIIATTSFLVTDLAGCSQLVPRAYFRSRKPACDPRRPTA